MRQTLLGLFTSKFLMPFHRSKFIPDYLCVLVENIFAILRGKDVRFLIEKDGSFFAKESGRTLKISNRFRGFWLYRNGIEAREDFIFKSYCLENITFKKDDIVFDCGANSGDLFLRLSNLIDANNYYAFEPNPEDFTVLKFNTVCAENLFNLALGNVDSEQIFYTATDLGDSSLIEPRIWNNKQIVKVVRLDSFIAKRKIESIKLLKLEAEGFEPEILEGLGNTIQRCEYIALDGAYERGRDCEQTFTSCTNYLLSNGFEIIDIYFPWYRALYKRK
jgi:hypothetical protein